MKLIMMLKETFLLELHFFFFILPETAREREKNNDVYSRHIRALREDTQSIVEAASIELVA